MWLQLANWAQIIGAILVALGGIVVYQLSKSEISQRDQRIADAEQATEVAKRERAALEANVASANERASRSQLELAKFKEPRTINDETRGVMIDALTQYAGQRYGFSASTDPESIKLLEQIDAVLVASGWVRLNPTGVVHVSDSDGNSFRVSIANIGVVVEVGYADERNVLAARHVAGLLHQSGIASTFGQQALPLGEEHPDAVHITVGVKPLD